MIVRAASAILGAIVVLAATGIIAAGQAPAAVGQAPRVPPVVVSAPDQAPAYSTIPVDVAVRPERSAVRRTATMSVSHDGVTFVPARSWRVTGDGRHRIEVDAGSQPGRLWVRVTVAGRGLPSRMGRDAVRITNPYRPTAPDNVDIPEAGVRVPATLFGNHPLVGAPEGAGTVRLWDTGTSWNAIEPTRGGYQWFALDRAVASAEAAGQQVLLVLGGTPSWAAVGAAPGPEFAGPGSSMPMADPAQFESYVRAVVARYGSRIAAYQIWNEANIPQFWRGTPELMADLTARAHAVIKHDQPGATVVAASTGSRWVKGFTEFYPEYLAALGRLGWPVDAYSVHLYPLASGTPRDRAFLLGMMKAALRIAGAPARPIWETEINYGITNPGLGETARTIPPEDVAGYVGRTYLDSLRFGIERSYWYAWTPDYRLLGMQMWTGYPASRAYRTIADWLVGSVFSGCATTGVQVLCHFDRAGRPFFVAYTDDAGPAVLTPPSGVSVATSMTGVASPVTGQVPISGTPVLLS